MLPRAVPGERQRVNEIHLTPGEDLAAPGSPGRWVPIFLPGLSCLPKKRL